MKIGYLGFSYKKDKVKTEKLKKMNLTIISDVSTNNGRPPGPGPIDAWFWSWMINPLQKAKDPVNKKYNSNLAIL